MDFIPITVECHAGYKADEYPKYFYWSDIKFEITEISDRWFQADVHAEWPPADYFKVITSDKRKWIIKHETKTDKWYVVKMW